MLNSRKSGNQENHLTIAIVGGGAGGMGATLELANAGYRVDLYEKNDELLSATSNRTPGRAGHGYHYIDEVTAKLYLDATIEVVKRYPGHLLGDGKPENHYLRHGLYCIMKQKADLRDDQVQFASIYPKEQILENYEKIKEHYKFLVAQDPSNKLFGEPEDFHRILSEAEKQLYRETINLDIVDEIIDTREELLNWPKLRKTLIDQVNNHPNIRVYTNSTVDNPSQRLDRLGFNFTVNGYQTGADFFINATWESIEELNQKISIYMEPDFRTNRLKTIIKAKLPADCEEHPSVFFCMGPHAMVSNMGDGTVMSTYAQVTNVSVSTGLFISDKTRQCLDGFVNFEKELEMANQILEGVSHYFPKMRDAKIKGKGYGIIKTRGTVDLFDPNSRVNKREEIGVEEQLVGWVDDACMKLLHFLFNGREVLALVDQSRNAKNIIEYLSDGVIDNAYPTNGTELSVKLSVLKNVLLMMLQRYSNASDYTDCSFKKGEENDERSEKLAKLWSCLFNSVQEKQAAITAISSRKQKLSI